jgi:hypothetical protein
MNWPQARRNRMIAQSMEISVLIAGVGADGQPYCLEDTCELHDADDREFTVTVSTNAAAIPLDDLRKPQFIEISFRHAGILYYSFVELIRVQTIRGRYCVTLLAPSELQVRQNRRFTRLTLPDRIPSVCRIVGLRRQATHRGEPFASHITELSGGGISFVTNARLLYPVYLQFNFKLPGIAEELELYGEVMRVTPFASQSYRVAAEFDSVSDATIRILSEYCNDRSIFRKHEVP